MEIVSKDLWSRVGGISKEAKFCRGAVAYLSTDDFLQFNSGDVIVVNASHYAIASGATSAKTLQKLF